MRRDAIDFGSDNIPKLFGKMLMPTLLGMLCMSVMTVIDGVFIGHGVGSDALAAVNIFSPFWLLMTAIGMMLGIGCSVVSSIHLSQDNVKAARINMTQTLIFGVTLALIITILVGAFSTRSARLLGSSDRLLPYVLDYQRWLSLAFCAMFLQSVGLLIIRLDGSPTYAMLTSSIPAILNIILDYVFLFVLEKGLEGVAFATFIGFWFGGGMVIFYILFLSKSMRAVQAEVVAKESLPFREKHRLPVPSRFFGISRRMQRSGPDVHRQLHIHEIFRRGWCGRIFNCLLHNAFHIHDRQCHLSVRTADNQLQPWCRQEGQGGGGPQGRFGHGDRRRCPLVIGAGFRGEICRRALH